VPDTYSRTIRAGTPATTHRSGTVPRTTEPAATVTFWPMHEPGRMMAPAPSQEPAPIETSVFTGHCRPMGSTGGGKQAGRAGTGRRQSYRNGH